MINRIIDFSLRNRLIIGVLTLILIAWGLYNFTKLPIDAVPDITNNQVQVITISRSLAPQEVEQFITFPVEIVMANLQGVTEIRSISRFGLSVVTIVFKDNIDPYLARQMVSEQIALAAANIPDGYGNPEMMPVTTGLGEIYQYVVQAKPGFEGKYSPMEIRTIQDWIIKRQLSGIPGIVDISSFGGFLKQFQVTVNPRTLMGMDITILEIFDALEVNNQNSGGSYIEKGPNAYYIRAEGLVKNEEDIENIVIKSINGIPILIKDVAEVTLGSPPRFGAMTKDGKGEAVGGITLMLRGANSAGVIGEVKKRIAQVQETLPPGLEIHPYLDRSKLISKTIQTVTKNLIEGGIIVIFILLLLVGNIRASLIVASVIPLSMLFAFSLMNVFGVSANLMSLGAIDFGLIVDGSVIVVEGILHRLEHRYKNVRLSQQELNDNIFTAAGGVGKSALFGVIIILIVYIPIFAFTGIEGKMFRPMAQTVSFALLGALLLSLTYVPMMASLFLNKNLKEKKSVSDKIVRFLNRMHAPVLEWSLNRKYLVLSIVAILMAGSFYIFSRMGGEFIPTLEEGDLAAQMTLTPGSSLQESIATSTKTEQILLDNFPEVLEVVSKIGTAEIPTDPMAMEDADIMIILKPKDEWTTAKTREGLADKMKEALAILPGVTFEFQQPIQLRFNELMTGVKSDVAVKIYGDDLDALFDLGNEAASLIQGVPGAGDVKVEQITGLPQLSVRYKRDKLAQYGLTVSDINKIIRTAFAGEVAGTIFEGEKRFDLVVRFEDEVRRNINSLVNLRVSPPSGPLVLLDQVADISYQTGPMQISRDNTHRRVTIGINIRNRDVQSFVEEIQGILGNNLKLPAGYYLTYGGQFENLQDAKRSSSIAVPVALAAIFILLYFAFNSLRQAIMIFTAIPMAAIGGIWALLLRGMPFSISGGVGFIALFGVAVLNGIVLIAYYNQLEKEGVKDLYERVLTGTRTRLRPVIMTAAVAALGFIPMAVSTASGAEVQRPLATVVIGGLVTSTFLTLIVLPVIYVIFTRKRKEKSSTKSVVSALILILLGLGSLTSYSQQTPDPLTMEKAVQIALENNLEIKGANLEVESVQRQIRSAVDIPNPEVEWSRGQINSATIDNHFMVSQQFHFPTVYAAQRNVQRNILEYSQSQADIVRNRLVRDVKSAYLDWVTLLEKSRLLNFQDSIYREFLRASEIMRSTGDINELGQIVAETKSMEKGRLVAENRAEIAYVYSELQTLMGLAGDYAAPVNKLERLPLIIPADSAIVGSNPLMMQFRQQEEIFKSIQSKEKWMAFPDIRAGYFNQQIDGTSGFQGWMAGISVPLWFWSYDGKIKSAGINREIAGNNYLLEQQRLLSRMEQYRAVLIKYDEVLRYYEEGANRQADRILSSASVNFREGEIDYIEFVGNVNLAFDIKLQYLQALNDYNQTVIEINYYLNKP